MIKFILTISLLLVSSIGHAGGYEDGYRNGYTDGFKQGKLSCEETTPRATLFRCTLSPAVPQYPAVQSGWLESEVHARTEAHRICISNYCKSPECGICVFARTSCETR